MTLDPTLPEPEPFVLRVDVPGDLPSVNETYKARAIVSGRRAFAQFYKGAKVKQYQATVATYAQRASPKLSPTFTGPVRVDLAFRFRRIDRDIDGPIKATLDALQGIAYADDVQVKAMWVTSTLDRDNPGVTIFVSEHK